MASKRRCLVCERPYTRSKKREFGRTFCSHTCLYRSRAVTVEVIYRRDDGVCHLCEDFVEREQASRDHLRPRFDGGRTTFANIKLAHRDCNSRRGHMPVETFRAKMAGVARRARHQGSTYAFSA